MAKVAQNTENKNVVENPKLKETIQPSTTQEELDDEKRSSILFGIALLLGESEDAFEYKINELEEVQSNIEDIELSTVGELFFGEEEEEEVEEEIEELSEWADGVDEIAQKLADEKKGEKEKVIAKVDQYATELRRPTFDKIINEIKKCANKAREITEEEDIEIEEADIEIEEVLEEIDDLIDYALKVKRDMEIYHLCVNAKKDEVDKKLEKEEEKRKQEKMEEIQKKLKEMGRNE